MKKSKSSPASNDNMNKGEHNLQDTQFDYENLIIKWRESISSLSYEESLRELDRLLLDQESHNL